MAIGKQSTIMNGMNLDLPGGKPEEPKEEAQTGAQDGAKNSSFSADLIAELKEIGREFAAAMENVEGPVIRQFEQKKEVEKAPEMEAEAPEKGNGLAGLFNPMARSFGEGIRKDVEAAMEKSAGKEEPEVGRVKPFSTPERAAGARSFSMSL